MQSKQNTFEYQRPRMAAIQPSDVLKVMEPGSDKTKARTQLSWPWLTALLLGFTLSGPTVQLLEVSQRFTSV